MGHEKISEKISEMIRGVIASLDRICPACMAATSDESAAQLHAGKYCPTTGRTAPARRDR